MTNQFFQEQRGAAVLKHAILRRYLPPFVGKVGSTSRDGRVGYVDGYAGSGTYESGAKGSPLLAMDISDRMKSLRKLECHLVEKKQSRCDQLVAAVNGADRCFIHPGDVTECFAQVLSETAGVPLFVFLDPFGLPPPMNFIKETVLKRRGTTELLINITRPGIFRNAGHIKEPSPNLSEQYRLKIRSTLISKMDDAMGGSWWQEIWLTDAEDRAHEIFTGYVERLREGWSYFWTGVPNSWEGHPVYYLLFLTQHSDGLWEFNNALSSAREEFLEWNVGRTGGEQKSLLEDVDRDSELVKILKANLERLLLEGKGFTPQGRMKDVFDEAIGQAREKHLRRALRELKSEDKILNETTGKLQNKLIIPAP